MPELTDSDRVILDAWSLSWSFPAVRDERIRRGTGLSPARSAQRLNRLLEDPAALAEYPSLVNRLRRFRESQRRRW